MGKLHFLSQFPKFIKRQNDELIFANVYHDTINNIDWMSVKPSISPGRYAVGYNYLYIMVRILNELRPHHCLDLGLGISSTLISQYMNYFDYEDGLHIIAEDNQSWIDFYKKNHTLAKCSTIYLQNLVRKEYGGGYHLMLMRT